MTSTTHGFWWPPYYRATALLAAVFLMLLGALRIAGVGSAWIHWPSVFLGLAMSALHHWFIDGFAAVALTKEPR